MHRFFVPPQAIAEGRVRFSPAQARQLGRVLRLGAGDRVLALDNAGTEYEVALERVEQGVAEGIISATHPASGEPRTAVTLYLAPLRGERFEWAVQKASELGAAAIVPLLLRRVVAVARPAAEGQRLARWRRIAQEAAEQCRRGRIPVISAPQPLVEALGFEGVALLPWEGESSMALDEAASRLVPGRPVALYIGPEGGFDAEEVQLARQAGATLVSLGPRTLRAETAAVVALTIVMQRLGELAPRAHSP